MTLMDKCAEAAWGARKPNMPKAERRQLNTQPKDVQRKYRHMTRSVLLKFLAHAGPPPDIDATTAAIWKSVIDTLRDEVSPGNAPMAEELKP